MTYFLLRWIKGAYVGHIQSYLKIELINSHLLR